MTIYNIHVLDYQSLAASLLIISDKIFHGISPAVQTVMNEHASSHPDFFRKLWAMIDFLFLRHGTINSDHITESRLMLRTPFDSIAQSLEWHRVHMTHQFTFLDHARHAVNNGDKLDLRTFSRFGRAASVQKRNLICRSNLRLYGHLRRITCSRSSTTFSGSRVRKL